MTEKKGIGPTDVTVEPTLALQVDKTSGTAPPEINQAMGEGFEALEAYRREHDLAVTGPPRAIYKSYDESGTTFTLALPVGPVDAEPAAGGDVRVAELPAGPALRFTHRGPYEGLMGTYEAIRKWLEDQGMLESEADWAKYMPMWEVYATDPTSSPADELVTYIYVPVPDEA